MVSLNLQPGSAGLAHMCRVLQGLDVQNAAAAEQHVKDMADYELKLTEAAAAWEADRKKKKGKAKDEVSRPKHSHLLSILLSCRCVRQSGGHCGRAAAQSHTGIHQPTMINPQTMALHWAAHAVLIWYHAYGWIDWSCHIATSTFCGTPCSYFSKPRMQSLPYIICF